MSIFLLPYSDMAWTIVHYYYYYYYYYYYFKVILDEYFIQTWFPFSVPASYAFFQSRINNQGKNDVLIVANG